MQLYNKKKLIENLTLSLTLRVREAEEKYEEALRLLEKIIALEEGTFVPDNPLLGIIKGAIEENR